MATKKEHLFGIMGASYLGENPNFNEHEPRKVKPKKEIIPKGLKEFFYGEKVIYALNKKNADKKALKQGLVIADVSKRFAIAVKNTDYIVKGRKYEIVESESLGHYIIDERGEEAYYHHSSLNVC